MRDLLFDFGITLGIRKTINQKKAFIDELEKRLNELNASYKVLDIKQSFFSSKHIIVGDVSKSKLILIANYDTPSLNLCRRFYYPLMTKENIRTDQINLTISTGVFILLNSIFVYSFNYINQLNIFLRIFLFTIELILFLFSIKLIDGIPNPINQNRNSASLVLMFGLIQKNSKDISYIFMDNKSGSLVGFKQCKKYLDNNKAKIILDSLASGKELYFASSDDKQFNHAIKVITEGRYWFNQIKNTAVLFTGDNHNNQYVIENSRFFNDYKVDQDRLRIIEEELLRYGKR